MDLDDMPGCVLCNCDGCGGCVGPEQYDQEVEFYKTDPNDLACSCGSD